MPFAKSDIRLTYVVARVSAISVQIECKSTVPWVEGESDGMGIEELRGKGRKLRAGNTVVAEESNVVAIKIRRKHLELIDSGDITPETVGEFPHRNAKFSPEVAEIIVAAVRVGNYFTTAASLADIHYNTLYRWLREGEEEPDGKYGQFSRDMHRAEAEGEVSIVSIIRTHAETDYRAGLELLGRRFPDRWSTRNRMELTGDKGGPVEIVVTYDEDGSDDV